MHHHVQRIGAGGVRRRQGDDAVLLRGGRGQLLHAAALAAGDGGRQIVRIVMRLVEVKDVIRRRADHLRAVGQDNRLQDVDHLRDIRHDHAVAVAVKDIQCQRRYHRVAHGVLLIEEARIRAGFAVEPRPPFVDNQPDAVLRIILVHNRQMTANGVIHPCSITQGEVVFIRIKIRCAAFVFPYMRNRVMMHRDGVKITPGALHQLVRPVPVAGAGPAGDAVELVVTVVAAERLVTAVFVGIVFRAHVAAAAPAFVAHAKIFEVERLLVPVRPALLHNGGIARGIHVLHPLRHFAHRTGADVRVDVGFAADLAAQFHELVRAEGIILHHAAPVRVHHALAGFFRADAVLPVVFIRKAAARPAQHRHADFLQRLHNVRAHAIDVGDVGVFAHIDAAVNAASEVLREMTVDVLVDFLAGLPGRVDGKDCRHLLVLRLFFVRVAPIARIHKVDIRPIYRDSCFVFYEMFFDSVMVVTAGELNRRKLIHHG